MFLFRSVFPPKQFCRAQSSMRVRERTPREARVGQGRWSEWTVGNGLTDGGGAASGSLVSDKLLDLSIGIIVLCNV